MVIAVPPPHKEKHETDDGVAYSLYERYIKDREMCKMGLSELRLKIKGLEMEIAMAK